HNCFDFAGFNPALGERSLDGFNRQIARRHSLIYNMPLANAGAADNPFIRSLNDFLEVGIGHHPRWYVSSQGRDSGARQLAQMKISPVCPEYEIVIVRLVAGFANDNDGGGASVATQEP